MATDTVLEKRVMLEVFRQAQAPTMFLSSWFRTSPRWMFQARKCVIDVVRNLEKYAIDVVRGAGGRLNKNKKFTTKEYTPPPYDEYSSVTWEELNERLPGQTEYTGDYANHVRLLISEDQVQLQQKIMRAIEVQAKQIFFDDGVVTLVNNDSLDYKQKGTHAFNAATKWSDSSATPWTDLENACELNRKDGKIQTGEFIAVMGKTAWANYLVRSESRNDVRNVRLADIDLPVPNTGGASFHGVVAAGSYRIQIWTYPQFYDVPSLAEIGVTLTGAGTTLPFVPVDHVLVIPAANEIDLRLVFAGIPELTPNVSAELRGMGFDRMPTSAAGDFHPYGFIDDKLRTMEIGVRSAPLCVPTQIDGFCVIDTEF